MSRRISRVVAFLLAVGAAGGTIAATASSSVGAEPIRIDAIGGTVAHNDFDDDGRFDMGDRVVVRTPLVDPATGERVGSAFWDCAATTRRVRVEARLGMWLCTAFLRLPEGDLSLEGSDPAGEGASTFAVTGGTGSYRNARGEADVVDLPDPDAQIHTEMTIRLEP